MKASIKPARCAKAGLLAAVLALAACSSSPPLRFYSLAMPAAAGAVATADAAPVRSAGLFIDVLAVGVPERLTRPQLVVRKGNDGRMDVLEQDRWTSPFNNELHDTLADGIAARLGAVDARRAGRQADLPLYRIAVNLRQFEAISGERVDAAFAWTVTRVGDGRSASCQASYSAPAAGAGGTEALVAAMQKTVAMATVAIAATVEGVRNGTDPACG
ncbi:MAG TPA: PqiC family protein [Herbaspirillum sp.]